MFYIAISHGIDFVVEVGGHALVQGDDRDAVAYGEGVIAFRDIDVTVFDGHAVDFGIGMFNDVPIRGGGITGKCFLPTIDDDAVGCVVC